MQQFTIKDIENLCGIKAHTLRIWEQRYQFFTPKRKESKHRMYDNEDLKHLLRVAFLYHHGWKISKIALLDKEEVRKMVEETKPNATDYDGFVLKLLEPITDFDKTTLMELLNDVIHSIGFEKAIIHVCYPMLQRLGMLWVTNNIIPAQEHFCSYLLQHKIIAETYNLPTANTTKPGVLLFCPEGEHHDLPLFFINYLLKKNEWNNIFLGPNISVKILQQFEHVKNIDYFFLHVITNFTGFLLDDYFENLCLSFRNKKIVASGAEIFQLQRHFTNLILLKSDEEIYAFIEGRHEAVGNT